MNYSRINDVLMALREELEEAESNTAIDKHPAFKAMAADPEWVDSHRVKKPATRKTVAKAAARKGNSESVDEAPVRLASPPYMRKHYATIIKKLRKRSDTGDPGGSAAMTNISREAGAPKSAKKFAKRGVKQGHPEAWMRAAAKD